MSAPFMQLYVADYLGDTQHLTTEQHGAYLLLLAIAHHNGGFLLDDDKRLARIAGLSNRKWMKHAETLRAFFSAVDGRLVPRHLGRWDALAKAAQGRLPLAKEVRAAVLLRDGETCRYCGTTDGPWHIDHVHPVRLGGTDALENLTVACAPCNLSKGGKTLAAWLA